METTSSTEDREICAKPDNTETDDDHISQLPEDIVSFILSFLNMKSAVRARVLSWRWRYVNASATNLKFDMFNIFGIKGEPANADKLRFVRAVDQFLQLYGNSTISSFKASYCLGNESACHIDKWVSIAIRMETEKLELDFSSLSKSREHYSFPCHLLPQGRVSQLKHLCLHKCKLEPSNYTNCFNSLKTLELYGVALDQSTLHCILSGCINVELLKLEECELPDSVSIHGKECISLRTLIINVCYGVLKIEFSSIDLKTFDYTSAVPRLSFVDVTSLEKLNLGFGGGYKIRMIDAVNGLTKDHSHLQTLSLFFQAFMLIPTSITQFSHLKELEFFVVQSYGFDLLPVVFILNASPSLQKFHLALQGWSLRSEMERTEFDTSQHFYNHQLKQVEITGFRIKTEALELELARYLLSNAVGLEQMIITKEVKRYRNRGARVFPNSQKMEESEKEWIHNLLSVEKVNPKVELILQ